MSGRYSITAFSDSVILGAVEAGLRLPSHTKLEILPLVSAYVGADLVAAALEAWDFADRVLWMRWPRCLTRE